MKSIEFGEEGLKNLTEIGQSLFQDEQDPTSMSYKRKLVRPRIRWGVIILNVTFPTAIAGMLVWLFVQRGMTVGMAICIGAVLLVLYGVIRMKRAIICIVRIYQRYAPEAVRRKCRFEPSCSEYMILALEKYGLFKGLKKGINRLKRCNINDGGYDMP